MFRIENEHSHPITNAKAEKPEETVTSLLDDMRKRGMINGEEIVLRDKEYGFEYPLTYPLQDIKRTVMVTPQDFLSPIINRVNEMNRYLTNAFRHNELLLDTSLSPIKADQLVEYTQNSINHRSYGRLRAKGITPAELVSTFRLIPTAVNEIVLENIPLGPTEIPLLVDMIQTSPSLTKVTLDGCGLGASSASVVEEAATHRLTDLTIRNDSVDQGVAAIAANSNLHLQVDPALYHFRPRPSHSLFHQKITSHPRRRRQTSTRSPK